MCKLSLNQNLTQSLSIDLSQTSLPIDTPMNEVVQMLAQRAYPRILNLWKNGVFGDTYGNGTYRPASNITPHAFGISGSNLVADLNASGVTANHAYTIGFNTQINFTGLSTVTVKTNAGNLNIDISTYDGDGYIVFDVMVPSGSNSIRAFVVTDRTNYASHSVKSATQNINIGMVYVTEITVS